jgi:hypothetical protein
VVSLCQTNPLGVCLPAGVAGSGWRVRLEPAVGVPPPPEGLLQSATQLPNRIRVYTNRALVLFWPVARAGTTASFVLCAASNVTPPRAIIISQTGRARISAVAADGSALACP